MRIPNQTLVLVMDGRKRLFLSNEGDGDFPRLREVGKAEDCNPPDRLQKSDAPGRTSSASGRRSAYDETDFHREQEVEFARATAELLNRQAEADEFQQLIVAADKRTLGELRAGFSAKLRQKLIGEVARDLVKHPIAEIEQCLLRA
jgi:protein required for attachment to host cells